MWVKIRQTQGDNRDLLLGIVYVSPINSTYTKNILSDPFLTWDILRDELCHFKDKYNVCLVGDFNARTETLPDYITHDDDTYVDLPTTYSIDKVKIRANCDASVNEFGNRLLQSCKMTDLDLDM